jgi:hypothetical protein
MGKLLFISCAEAKSICDKDQYGEATDWEKLKLNIRLSWCKITKSYYNRNVKLTKMIEASKTINKEDKATSGLSDAIKNSIKYEFEKALKGTK